MVDDYKKHDLVSIKYRYDLSGEKKLGEISNCLIYKIEKDQISFYPINDYIRKESSPGAVPLITMKKQKIISLKKENLNGLLYAIGAKHSFIQKSIQYYINNASKSRKN